jgi:hypothetical protein
LALTNGESTEAVIDTEAHMKNLIAGMICFFLLIGCATQVSTTNKLSPGMRPEQVKAALGEPSQTQFIGNKWVWNYSLLEPWKGFVPYYVVFSKENPVLESWYADQDEYYRHQELWLKAFPPTKKQQIDVR